MELPKLASISANLQIFITFCFRILTRYWCASNNDEKTN
ncbi:hypothetical protein W04_2753 [Pseudoalteromonas sp. SW0106-04]|nr:hypothetical protein W04_2753 [Pseudoalteromonas sp. SW0106-04]